MAKIRVYELARDLNMTNKDLLAKLREMEIEINSHMSSLDEETTTRVKNALKGGPEPNLEETRITPGVIRRRRKVVKPAAPETIATAEIPAEEAAAAAAPTEADEAPPAEAAPPEKTAARVVAPVEQPTEADELVPEAVVLETVDAAASAETAAADDVAAERPDEAAETAPAPTAEATDTVDAEPADAPGEAAAETAEQPLAAETAAVKPKRGEAPAKIIKLPKKPVTSLKPSSRPKPTQTRPPRPARPGAYPDLSGPPPGPMEDRGDARKKGRKKGAPTDIGDKRVFKKKGGFRRREVIEGRDLYSGKRGRKGKKGKGKAFTGGEKTQITTAKAIKRRVKMDETIVLSELAKRMGIKANEMIVKLMGLGVMATVNQTIDFDTAVLVAGEFDYEVEKASFEEEAILKVDVEDAPEQLMPRPPVVTIMGHVDHGKTSLLDVIRQTRITDHEAGGITQHIGAYNVTTLKGQIVFLDTPGHEAFSAMRSRGAQVTDLVILVVAADDGIMPQTVEAINHSRAAEVPIIVAVNKMDKADADPDKVMRQLAEMELVPEEWGGDTITVKVSAKQNSGIDDLLEMILLQSEMLELKANPDKKATGHVVEAKLDSGRGPVATVLINDGTLKVGDPVVCGVHFGKLRALLNDVGQQVDSAGPAIPVEIVGLSGVPTAGDELVALDDEKDAKQVSEHRLQKQRSLELAKTSRLSLEKLYEQMQEGEVQDLNVIIKADVDGSIEALRDSLVKLSNEEVNINVVHAATGTISESDVSLAAVSNAIIIGFNVRPNTKVREMAQEENVDIRYHNVIYNVIKEVKDAIVGLMKSTFEERLLGKAEVRQVFHVPKVGSIAGSYVVEGKIERGRQLRLLRDGIVIYEGRNASLRRYKDDVKEVQSGYECGIGIENFNDIKVGDHIECFYMEEIRPDLA
ncbi:MAG: translation initiation factor IF-2 [Desulfosarcinaceae bacterium]|nr:translation initiation factor IF-2 [Desulfosarcinaceae bacterium]